MLYLQVTDKLGLGLEREIAMLDPNNTGFAFGGLLPGWIGSKGQVVETHKVHYSIGKAGRYLLHVRLHQAARPLPGSPFALTVLPGSADASCTWLPEVAHTLRGEVGTEEGDGVRLVMRVADRSGNMCVEGGAPIKITCAKKALPRQFLDTS